MKYKNSLLALVFSVLMIQSAVADPPPFWTSPRYRPLQPEYFTLGLMYQGGTANFLTGSRAFVVPADDYESGGAASFGLTLSRRMYRSGTRLHTGIFKTERSYIHSIKNISTSTGLGSVKTRYIAEYLTVPLGVSFAPNSKSGVLPFGKLEVTINQLMDVQSVSGYFGSIGPENTEFSAYNKADFKTTNVLFQFSGGTEIYLSEDRTLSLTPEIGWQFAFEDDKSFETFTQDRQTGFYFSLDLRYHFYANQTARERREQRKREIEAKRKELEEKIKQNLENHPDNNPAPKTP